MTREEAKSFWQIRYESAKDFSDPNWDAQERREHREYVEALRIAAEHTDCTDFVNWLLEEVMDEEMWELNAVANGEVIARKLKKLGLLEVKDGYYTRPSADAVQGWTPCSERLPEEYDEYLCQYDDGDMIVGWLENEEWCKKSVAKENIVAWMELPEPYRGDEDER